MSFESIDSHDKPKIILILSGKRKSGKDYVADILHRRFGDKSTVVRLSGPLKERYAAENNLDYFKLLDASEYKELFRTKMICWGEEIRATDPGYFCRHAIIQAGAVSKDIWIVSDARRKTDIEYFCKHYPFATHKIRIQASYEVREKRGWKFKEGVDDCESECGLDSFKDWDFVINNNEDEKLMDSLENVFSLVNQHM